jgi:hypothetical protein
MQTYACVVEISWKFLALRRLGYDAWQFVLPSGAKYYVNSVMWPACLANSFKIPHRLQRHTTARVLYYETNACWMFLIRLFFPLSLNKVHPQVPFTKNSSQGGQIFVVNKDCTYCWWLWVSWFFFVKISLYCLLFIGVFFHIVYEYKCKCPAAVVANECILLLCTFTLSIIFVVM